MKRLLLSIALTSSVVFSPTTAAAVVTVEPDAFPSGTEITNAFPAVTLNTVRTGADANVPTSIGGVFSATDPNATTGTRAFAQPGLDTTWGNGAFEYLRATFASPVSSASLDFFANDLGGDTNAQLLAFDSGGNLIDTEFLAFVAFGQPATLTVDGSISSIRGYWDEIARVSNGGLDHLTYTTVPEPGTFALLTLAFAGFVASRRLRSSVADRR
jgi:PEP-CTERM motif-containing protein